MGPYKARCIGALSLLFVPLFGAPKCNTSKIRERDMISALGGHLLVRHHNNHLKVGIAVGGLLGRAHDMGGTCGVDAIPSFGAAN